MAMKVPKMTPKQFIRWRTKLGLTQSEAAVMLGYKNRSSICHLEQGIRPITTRTVLACQALSAQAQ
jgi:hypothetical protein